MEGLLLEALLRELDHLAVVGRDEPGRAEQVGLAQAPLASSPACRRRSRSGSRRSRTRRGRRAGCGASTRELTCCWKITLGKIVVITAVGPPHHGSGTMSRKRGSSSFMSALKLDTCVTCARPPVWPRRRDHRRVAVVRVHQQLRLVVGAPEAEGDEPGVQQARVVRVLDVFLHQLPVARDALAVVAEDRRARGRRTGGRSSAGSSGRGSPRAARRRGRTTRTRRRRAPRP